jgi:hypothetical protein
LPEFGPEEVRYGDEKDGGGAGSPAMQ